MSGQGMFGSNTMKPFSHNQPNKSQPSVINAANGTFTYWPVTEIDRNTKGLAGKIHGRQSLLHDDVREIVGQFGFILNRNYWYSFTEFAHEIERTFDMTNPQVHWAVQTIKLAAQMTVRGKSLYPKFMITPDNKPVSIKTMAAALRGISKDPNAEYNGWDWFPVKGWAIQKEVRRGIHDRINRRGHEIVEQV
jgi:hypothetical protein